MNEPFSYLFSPLTIGSVTVKNRICFPAHGTLYADKDNILDDRYVEYQRARAKGGAGLVIAGVMYVMPNCRSLIGLHELHDERAVPMLLKLAEAVHEEDAKIFVQIGHNGRIAFEEMTRRPCWAPSAVPDITWHREVPKEMEIEDIKAVVEAFSRAAGFAKEAGLDGVEIHGSSGYLLAQFMSPSSNRRTDEYGGSMDNRLRLTMEVIDAVREKVGDERVVGIRIAGDELAHGGNDFDDMKRIARKLEATGKIDYIHTGLPFFEGFFNLGFGMHTAPGLYTPYAAGFREIVDLPVMNTFRINDPAQAEKILADGHADLIGMVRALIADPELPDKARKGKTEEIRHCIGCDQGCFGRTFNNNPLSCTQNAVAGLEKKIGPLEPARVPKKVLVAGGGAAGMETARVAKLRGHEVSLYDKQEQLGGQVNIAVKAPKREEFEGIGRYLIRQMEILGVKVFTGTEVDPALIEREAPDAVVVATGSTPFRPSLPGADQNNVVNVWDVLQDKVEIGEKVVVVDGGEAHWQCCSTAEYLAEMGKKVEIITPLLFVGAELASTTDLGPYYWRVRRKGVVFSPNTVLKEISGTALLLMDPFANEERRIEGVDTIVLAMGNRANDGLYRNLKGKIKEIHAVGDCLAPRKAIDAIYEGYNLGRII